MFNPVAFVFQLIANQLSNTGLIDRERGKRISALAWPRFLTMFARHTHRVADVAMVGIAVGPAAIAGLAFAFVYRRLAIGFPSGIAGGTISQVSQRFGAEQYGRLDLAVKQSVWITLLLILPFVFIYGFFTESLIAFVGNDAMAIGYGAAYLEILSIGFVFTGLNLVASRTLAGADDTWIAMSIRASGAAVNIVLNAIFIFGFGLGVRGAAMGTVLAEATITACFIWGFLAGSLPIVGEFPVTLSLKRPYFNLELTKQLMTITPPIIIQKLIRAGGQFPLFMILALFGPTVVAAFEVARRIRGMMRSTSSGFSMSASSLVGQELGQNDELEADNYARDVIRFSTAVYITATILVFTFARPLAHIFTDDPSTIPQTVTFIRVAAVSFVAQGTNFTLMGILKAAGDNRWPMYGRFVGLYLVLIPITYLGVITPLGVMAVYLAMVAETFSAVLITHHRVNSGKWKIVSRTHRPAVGDN